MTKAELLRENNFLRSKLYEIQDSIGDLLNGEEDDDDEGSEEGEGDE